MTDYAKVTDLTEATTASDSDLIEVQQDQGGGNYLSKKITKANLIPKTPGSIGLTTDAGKVFIVSGLKGYVSIPYNATITSWSIVANKSGSIVVDVWKKAGAIPTAADSITASAKPTLSSQQLASSSTLTGWQTTITAGDVIAFNVVSTSALNRVTVSIEVEK